MANEVKCSQCGMTIRDQKDVVIRDGKTLCPQCAQQAAQRQGPQQKDIK